jgi:hypothetical protein
MRIKDEYKPILTAFVFCLTLGLAPFTPQPHIIGKLQWIIGGAKGMQQLDWFDTLLHGTPWVYLIYEVVKLLVIKVKGN